MLTSMLAFILTYMPPYLPPAPSMLALDSKGTRLYPDRVRSWTRSEPHLAAMPPGRPTKARRMVPELFAFLFFFFFFSFFYDQLPPGE
jgi:hypothetical protein